MLAPWSLAPRSLGPRSLARGEQEGDKTDDRDSVAQVDADEVGDSEEENIFVEEEMVLRVGHGGRFGTLHVRFVGKELHVTVEDAELVIEAVPNPTKAYGLLKQKS